MATSYGPPVRRDDHDDAELLANSDDRMPAEQLPNLVGKSRRRDVNVVGREGDRLPHGLSHRIADDAADQHGLVPGLGQPCEDPLRERMAGEHG